MPPTPDLSFTGLDEFVNEHVVENSKDMSSEEEPKVVRKNDDAPIIEVWVSDDEEDDVSQPKIEKKTIRPSIVKKEFVKSKQQEKSTRKTIKQIDSNYQQKQFQNQRMVKPVWNNAQRVNHQNFAKKTHPCAKKNFVSKAVLMKSGLVSINTARQNIFKTVILVNTARQNIFKTVILVKTTVDAARSMSYLSKTAYSTVKRPIHKNTTFKNSNINQRVNTTIKRLTEDMLLLEGNPKGGKITGKEMNQFCEMKGIMRQFSLARTPQQNGVAERRNKTLIEATRTMLADSKLPNIFWAEAVNTACYVQNRVLVVKPHNKTPNELFHGRAPILCFMRPFGYPVTILNTIDHLGKFDGKAHEGFFVGYSLNSKAFRVFNSRTRIVEENLHIRFSESTPNVVGSGTVWLFDIDALTRTMNYEPIIAGTQSNSFAGTKASDNAGQARKEIEPVKDYILLPLWTTNLPFYQDPKSSNNDGSKPSSDDGKKVDKDSRKDSECNDQENEDNVNSTNNVNTVSSTVNAAGINEVNAVGGKTCIKLPFDPNMSALEDYGIFDFSRGDEDDGAEANMNNLDTIIQASPNPTTRIHKDHPLDQEEPKKVENALYGDYIQALGRGYDTLSTYLMGFKRENWKDLIHQKKGKTASTPWKSQIYCSKDEDGERKVGLCACARLPSQIQKVSHLLCEQGFLVQENRHVVAIFYNSKQRKAKKSVKLMMEKLFRMELELMLLSITYYCWVKVNVVEDKQLNGMSPDKRIFIAPSHTKKIFGNMRRLGKGFSGRVTPLFQTMVVQNQSQMGKDLAIPTDPHHTPTVIQSSTQPKKTQKPRKPKRKDTQVPQPSDPMENVADEVVHKELGDSLVRATKIGSSLEAEQDSGNITKTQSKATPNESSSLGTTSGGGLRRVKKLEKKNRSRTHKLKRLYKVGLTTRVESSGDEENLGEDASKQGRRINVIDVDEDITLVNVQDDADNEMFDVNALNGKEVFGAWQNENVVEEVVDVAQVSTIATTVTITTEEITLAQALEALKTSKPKVKGIVFQEPSTITTTTTISSQQSHDKGKGIMIEETVKSMKKKDLIRLDEEIALKLQAEFDEEERLAREKAEKEKANISLIET
ncbi:ribonuclease H-like domain-containing protein [Tanacetum coccineum]